jgi:hypothetical protein
VLNCAWLQLATRPQNSRTGHLGFWVWWSDIHDCIKNSQDFSDRYYCHIPGSGYTWTTVHDTRLQWWLEDMHLLRLVEGMGAADCRLWRGGSSWCSRYVLRKDEGRSLAFHLRKNPAFSRDFSKGETYCILAALLEGEWVLHEWPEVKTARMLNRSQALSLRRQLHFPCHCSIRRHFGLEQAIFLTVKPCSRSCNEGERPLFGVATYTEILLSG